LITSNEGHYDVYSKQDSTTFIYDINKEKFLESLDVFLHSFINPLFREELIRKELNLIKSEYKKYEQSPEIKFDNLFLQISNNQRTIYNSTSENKHHLFNITSDDQILRDYVLQHFNKHYVGRNMKIMIFGNFEVQNVEKLILNNLVKVQIQEAPFPNKINFKKIPDHSSSENVLFSFIQPKIVFYRSENNVLKVFFNIQNVSRDIKNYLTSYLKYIISSEYKNSLLHNLIKNKLVFNLKLKFFDRKNDLFSINFIFELTQLGFNNPEIILKLLYKFTDLIRINAIQKSSYETIKNRLIHRFK
jgi:insulysin